MMPPGTSRLQAVRLWHERWKIEQGYQQMKEELGLDHFEGRSWRGFHPHAVLVLLAFGFLALEQRRAKQKPPPKKSLPSRQVESPCPPSVVASSACSPPSPSMTAPTAARSSSPTN